MVSQGHTFQYPSSAGSKALQLLFPSLIARQVLRLPPKVAQNTSLSFSRAVPVVKTLTSRWQIGQPVAAVCFTSAPLTCAYPDFEASAWRAAAVEKNPEHLLQGLPGCGSCIVAILVLGGLDLV